MPVGHKDKPTQPRPERPKSQHPPLANLGALKEKADKFDELQRWYWWLERRTFDGKTPKVSVETFLKGIKEYFEPYDEVIHNERD